MSRALVARALRAVATLVAGDDPVGLALAAAVRAEALARLALAAAERVEADDRATLDVALRTRGVVGAMLRGEVGGTSDDLLAELGDD